MGPPVYLLHFLRWLAVHHPDQPVVVMSLTGGDLGEDFAEVGPVIVLDRGERLAPDVRSAPGLVYVNTAISVRAGDGLPTAAVPWVAHVHEMEIGLSFHIDDDDWSALRRPHPHWIAASRAVADNLVRHHGMARDEIVVHHEMVDSTPVDGGPDSAGLRRSLGIVTGERVVGTVAAVSWRKAPDLFLQLAVRLDAGSRGSGVHLVWVGADRHDPASSRFREDLRRAGLEDRVHVVDAVADPAAWMRAFDVFVLPAREDAFPLACLEAAAVGCPIVCFDTGGMPEFVEDDAGVVVPYPRLDDLARAVQDLVEDPDHARRLGEVARMKVRSRHDVEAAAPLLFADLRRWER